MQHSENYNSRLTFDLRELYEQEVFDICKDSSYMGIWQIFQCYNIIHFPIQSVHPRKGNPNVRKDLNHTVFCIEDAYSTEESIKIM